MIFVNKAEFYILFLNFRELGKPTSGKWIVRCERPEIRHNSLDRFSKHAGHNLSSCGRIWRVQHPSAKEEVTTKARPSADLRSRHFTPYCFRKTSKSLQNLPFNPKTSKEKGDNKTFTLIPSCKRILNKWISKFVCVFCVGGVCVRVVISYDNLFIMFIFFLLLTAQTFAIVQRSW